MEWSWRKQLPRPLVSAKHVQAAAWVPTPHGREKPQDKTLGLSQRFVLVKLPALCTSDLPGWEIDTTFFAVTRPASHDHESLQKSK
mmetsp:Transcript_42600/g.76346  ORF Transcript_42600/g.76346 Transcript_42600/m.76346 type:complete len:86 (+) Transcript_42600:1170-1427(+)